MGTLFTRGIMNNHFSSAWCSVGHSSGCNVRIPQVQDHEMSHGLLGGIFLDP